MPDRMSVAEYNELIGKTGPRRKTNTRSAEKELLGRYLMNCGVTFAVEYRFAPPRRWKFDWALPALMLAIEFEGGTYINGAHTRGEHYESDCEKYSNAALMGWKVIRVTANMVRSGLAIELIERGLGVKK